MKNGQEHLEELINQGLLQYNQIKGTYSSTPKGLNSLNCI